MLMSGTEQEPGGEGLREAIARDVAGLPGGAAFMISEFAAAGFITWEVRRDQDGTPHARQWLVPWSELYHRREPGPSGHSHEQGRPGGHRAAAEPPAAELAGSELTGGALTGSELTGGARARITQAAEGSSLLLVCSAPADPSAAPAFALARGVLERGGVTWRRAFTCPVPLEDLLLEVFTDDPLTQWYDLVALRRTPEGRLVFTTRQLFAPGAVRGAAESLTVRCEPSDDAGTVFAVMAYRLEERTTFRRVTQRVANVPHGTYELTAELRRPGEVRFRLREQAVKFRPDRRSWEELVARVPPRLDRLRPAHLIVAVEVSGSTARVLERIDRAEQLIRCVAAGADGPLHVSLISFGAHAVHRDDAEEPVTVLSWAQSSGVALAALSRLRERGAAPPGYSRAAQLECMLTTVATRLTGEHGRPVLVTAGSRPAFPRRVDRVSEIIPCPNRNDWAAAWYHLRQHPGMAFGAIRDFGPGGEAWRHLGHDAAGQLAAVDVRRFAADLGLVSSTAQYIPFPLVEAEEG